MSLHYLNYDVPRRLSDATHALADRYLNTDEIRNTLIDANFSVPESARGSVNLEMFTSSADEIAESMVNLYNRIVDPHLLIRRVNITANHVTRAVEAQRYVQLSLFDDAALQRQKEEDRRKEQKKQQAILELQRRYGKNAVLKGMNYLEGATTMERNKQVGGHKA